MSPTIFEINGIRFFTYSQEEDRAHVHLRLGDGRKIKIWIEPGIEVANNQPIKDHEISILLKYVEENIDAIRAHWQEKRQNRS